MDEASAKIQEVCTGLTVHLQEYRMSESTTHAPKSTPAGPSYRHASRRHQVEDDIQYRGISRSTQEDVVYYYRHLYGGNGSDREEEDPNVPDPNSPGHPNPPGCPNLLGSPNSPAPPNAPGPPERRKRQTQKDKLINVKDPHPFKGNQGEHFDAFWIIVETYMHDQQEKFDNMGRTIKWVAGIFKKCAAAWHVQWEWLALGGKFPRSWTTYQNDLMLRFEDNEAWEEANTEFEKTRHKGDMGYVYENIDI